MRPTFCRQSHDQSEDCSLIAHEKGLSAPRAIRHWREFRVRRPLISNPDCVNLARRAILKRYGKELNASSPWKTTQATEKTHGASDASGRFLALVRLVDGPRAGATCAPRRRAPPMWRIASLSDFTPLETSQNPRDRRQSPLSRASGT
jgi:hypothetical protein